MSQPTDSPFVAPREDRAPEGAPSNGPGINSGLFTWATVLIAVGVLLIIQAVFIRMGVGIFFAVLFGAVGAALIASALVRPKRRRGPA